MNEGDTLIKITQQKMVENIPFGFNYFKKDLRRLKQTKVVGADKKILDDKAQCEVYETIKDNLKDAIIFEIKDTEENLNPKFSVIPFDKMFVSTNIFLEYKNDAYTSTGFYIQQQGDIFLFCYVWGRVINDGWNLSWFVTSKEIVDKNINSQTDISLHKVSDYDNPPKLLEDGDVPYLMFSKKIIKIFRNLLLKIEKREYTTYKKWSPMGFETKEITYARDVCSHKRHFWSDTDYFNIPRMSKEEWEKRGYGTDEVVFKDGVLRRDVPFSIIGQQVQGKDKPKKETNRIINLFKRRQLKQEEKIYGLLKQLYPDKLIRRHDRKTLNGVELDFNIPEFRLGIEYDGEQHFDKKLYEDLYGEGFEEQVKRDRLKDKLCRKKNIKLIRIKFDEPITLAHIKKILK